ncbi:MAG: carboxypeptidase regulatory-like domain-containing protein [Acidobacteriaceae bacterium]
MRSFRFGKIALAVALALFVALPFLSGTAHAQGITTGTISGSVTDPTGALIPGATVTASRGSTGETAKTVTGKDGSFSFKDLQVGTYSVVVAANGFAGKTLNNVEVDANRDSALGSQKLATSGAQEVVEVSAAANILETSQAQVTTTFSAEQLTNLPVSGGFDEVALLIPGVVSTHMAGFSNTNGVGISANGQRGRSNNFELDGQSNNDNSVAGPQVFFSNDEALQQIQVITNDFSAQYGRNMGSIVNYITKSGTNTWHGSGIYRYSNDFTSSLSPGNSKGPEFGFCVPGENSSDGCIPTVVPRYVSNWWGGTLGGPIIRNKLFAFGSTYFNHFLEAGALTSSGTSLFPTSAGLTMLASAFPNSPAIATLNALDPYSVKSGNPVQLNSTNAACSGGTCYETVAANGVSISNVPFAPFGRTQQVDNTDQEDLGRIDWQPTAKDRLYVRYFYQKEPDQPDNFAANGGFVNVRDAVHSVGADITHIFGPRWVDQLRYSFQQSTLAFDGGGFSNCTIVNFATCPSSVSIGKLTTGSESSLGLADNLPQGRIVKAGQVQDNATWSAGHHSITFGGEFDYTNSPNTFLPNSSGTFTFDSFDDFIANGCSSGNCTLNLTLGNPVIPFKEEDVALYFQDDWKVTPSLTLNLGLRWEFFQQALNLLHNESVKQQTGSDPFWSTALPLSQTTLAATPNYYKNYEPRIGFAYNPQFAHRVVVRGGFAMNVDPGFYNINLNVASSAPLVAAGTVYCTGTNTCLPTGGATFSNVQQQDAQFVPRGGNPGEDNETNVSHNFREPYAETYTLGVEYQIRNSAVAEARYTGNHTIGNFQSLDANPYLGDLAADFPNVVSPSSICTAADSTLADGGDIGHQTCGLTNVRTRANTAFANYNSLQLSLTTRSYHGVTSTFAYTWSHTIDNTSEIFGTFGGGNTVAFSQSPLNTDSAERGNSGTDFPNVASISFTYKIPTFHTGHGITDRVVNGWQANTVWLYNSGQPYNDYDLTSLQSPQVNGDDPNTYLSYSDQAEANAFSSGVDFGRPILSNPKAPVGTLGIYTDSDATGGGFTAPVLVDYATGASITPSQVRFISNNRLAAKILNNPFPGSGRNILRGNTYNNVDFSVFKDTRITNRVTFHLEVDAYNVLNRAYYGNPDNFEGDYPYGSFNNFYYADAGGSFVGFGTGLRNLTFGGKILF